MTRLLRQFARFRHPLCFAAIAISLTFGGCRQEEKRITAGAPELLDDGWQVAAPADFGADRVLLDAMVDSIESGEIVNIHGVIIVKGGVLVFERYFEKHQRDTLHEIRSATKSIGSILTGIAIDRGFLSSEEETIQSIFESDYSPAGGWRPQARELRIRHLLSMMSGQDCDDLATNFACEDAMYASGDWLQYSLDLPFAHPPGSHWAYNSASLILVGQAVARGAGMSMADFADRHLFGPLGIDNFQWNFSPKGHAWIGGGARMIPREMAKIGQLMLNRGVWQGERLLSEEWIDKSTVRQGDMRGGVDYGYLWQRSWAYIGEERVTAYWASGNGGQYIIVLPDQNMVVVFTGGNFNSPLAGQPFRLLASYILPAFLRPARLEKITLEVDALKPLTGTYKLDFEPSATSTVSLENGRLRLLSPDNEEIDLIAHSPLFFSAESQYGPLAVFFEADVGGEIDKLIINGSFSSFVFLKN